MKSTNQTKDKVIVQVEVSGVLGTSFATTMRIPLVAAVLFATVVSSKFIY